MDSRRRPLGTFTYKEGRYQQLRDTGLIIARLKERSNLVAERVAAANLQTGPIMADLCWLLNLRHRDMAEYLLHRWIIDHFTVSDEDRASLVVRDGIVDGAFFDAVAKMKLIVADSRVLVLFGKERLAGDVVSMAIAMLNGGFEKAGRWVDIQLKTLDFDNPQVGPLMRRALRFLAERPAKFQASLEKLATSRARVLSDAFTVALRGSLDGAEANFRPIEHSADDPLRYTGDIFAWVHSTAVSERETLEGLFMIQSESLEKGYAVEDAPWNQLQATHPERYDAYKELNELVGRILGDVSERLKARIKHVLSFADNPSTVYKLGNLIAFYRSTFANLLGSTGPIDHTLLKLDRLSGDTFTKMIRDRAREVKSEPVQVTADLAPPAFLEEALAELREIMNSYDNSIAPGSDAVSGFDLILKDTLEPYLLFCEDMAKELKQPTSSIFRLNFFLATKKELELFDFTKDTAEDMGDIVQIEMKEVVGHLLKNFIRQSGIQDLLEGALTVPQDSREPWKAIRDLPAFQPRALAAASQVLDSFLPSAVIDASKSIGRLRDPNMVRAITETAASSFCKQFEFVERKILEIDSMGTEEAAERNVQRGTHHVDEDTEGFDDEVPGAPERLRPHFPRQSYELRILLLS